MSDIEDTREAISAIATESPEAAGLVVALMEHSSREREWIEDAIKGSLETERDYWKDRALQAERQLAAVETRVMNLLAPAPEEWDPNDLGP